MFPPRWNELHEQGPRLRPHLQGSSGERRRVVWMPSWLWAGQKSEGLHMYVSHLTFTYPNRRTQCAFKSTYVFHRCVLVVVFYNSHDSKVLSLCFIDLILLRWCISATKDQNVPVINICNSNEWTNSTRPPVVKYTVGHLIPKSAKRFKPSWRCWRIQKSDFMSFCNSVPVSHSSHLENFGLLFLMGESELSLTMFGKSSRYTFRQWEY